MIRKVINVFSYSVFSKALLGVATLLIIRDLQQEQYAIYSYSLAIVGFMSQSISVAFNRIYIIGFNEFGSDTDGNQLLGGQYVLMLGGALFIYPFIQISDALFAIIISVVFLTSTTEFLKTMYQKNAKFNKYSLIDLGKNIFFLGALSILVLYQKSEILAIHILFLQSLAMFFLVIPILGLKRIYDAFFGMRKGLIICKKIALSKYKYLFGYFIVLAFFSQLDIFMLEILSHEKELANYGAGFRFYSLLLMALGAVHVVLIPMIQEVVQKSDLRKLYLKHRNLTLVFTPMVLIISWLSQWFIPLIDEGKYPIAIDVFQVLSFSSIISFGFSPYAHFLMRFEKFKYLFILICMGVVLNIILNISFIPVYGSIGAAWATLFAFALVNAAIYLYAKLIYVQTSNVFYK